MDDGHIVTVDLLGLLRLQETRCLEAVIHSQLVCGSQCASCALATGILYVGAAHQNLTRDGIQRFACLITQQSGGFHQVVVDGSQKQNIGQFHIIAVLRHSGGKSGHVQFSAVRSDTLGDGSQRLGERAVLAEFDGLTAVLRDRMLLAELVMHQQRLGIVDQVVGVIDLHFRRQVVGADAVVRGQVGVVEKLQIQCKLHKFVEHRDSPFLDRAEEAAFG